MYEQIARNKRRTFLMLAAFVFLIAAVAVALGLLFRAGVAIVPIAIGIAIAMAWTSYFTSDKIALAASRAKPADGPEYARYHNLVEGLCIAAGLPKPRLYIVDDPAPNAFATGRNPQHAALAVTTGLLAIMNRVELEGVLAHELSHVRNYDILVSTIAVTAVGAVALMADLGLRFMWFGGRSNRRDNNNGGGAGAILAILAMALLVLAPFAAQLMQFAVSRRRELLADASGVQLTRYPPGLISALKKLQADQTVVHHATRATAQLWIESPLERDNDKAPGATARGNRLNRKFDTHPPLAERIAALEAM
ncbi:MAG: M48 family metalloprotease [Acidimicrobiia bacterium]|nr:M48 family metalloprotease [Acidimicrobiia bacterium]